MVAFLAFPVAAVLLSHARGWRMRGGRFLPVLAWTCVALLLAFFASLAPAFTDRPRVDWEPQSAWSWAPTWRGWWRPDQRSVSFSEPPFPAGVPFASLLTLTARTKVCAALGQHNALNRRAASRARLALLPVNPVEKLEAAAFAFRVHIVRD